MPTVLQIFKAATISRLKESERSCNTCAADPKEIEEALPQYDTFGAAVDQEKAAAWERRQTLISNANAEMQKVATSLDISVAQIEQVFFPPLKKLI
eukprot:SAG11_NODE_301_length_11038_cov_2.312826_5_plen_96_part_00